MESMNAIIAMLEEVKNEINEDAVANGGETIHAEWVEKLQEVIDALDFIDA